MRSKNGEAISKEGRSAERVKEVRGFVDDADRRKDRDEWRRGRAVLGYIDGRRVTELAAEAGVTRGSVNRWLQWYNAAGVDGLRTQKPPGPAPRLSEKQREELTSAVDAGPQAAGYTSGVWTGPMIGDLIAQRFGVRYHNYYVPRLLHALGFSVQRPRKRLARADLEAQATWVNERFPAIKKKPRPAEEW